VARAPSEETFFLLKTQFYISLYRFTRGTNIGVDAKRVGRSILFIHLSQSYDRNAFSCQSLELIALLLRVLLACYRVWLGPYMIRVHSQTQIPGAVPVPKGFGVVMVPPAGSYIYRLENLGYRWVRWEVDR